MRFEPGLWAARVRSSGLVAGTVLLTALPDSDEIEVGWHFHPDSWLLGLTDRWYGTELQAFRSTP